MAIYYVRADGAANKGSATNPNSPSTSMGLANLLSAVSTSAFADGDRIVFSPNGGQYNIRNSPDNRIFFQGGSLAPVFYETDEWVSSPAVIDGGGVGGPLVFANSATQKIYDVSGIKLQNCSNSYYVINAQNALISIHDLSGNVISGNTFIEGNLASIITLYNIDDFNGFDTHWVGLHDTSHLEMYRCAGVGGKVNAVHGINMSSANIRETEVLSPSTLGTSAFLLQGSGVNIIERSKVKINRPAYAAFAHSQDVAGNVSEMFVNNCVVEIVGPVASGDSAIGFDICNYVGAGRNGKITANKCIVYSKTKISDRAFGARLNEGSASSTGELNLNNTIFSNLTRPFRVSPGGVVSINSICEYNSGSNSIVSGGFVNYINKLATNPNFVDVQNDNIHLRANSPCLGTGTKIPGITTDIEGNPLFPPYNIGPCGLAEGALGVASVVNDGPPRNNITRLTGTSTTINPEDTYQFDDTNGWRVVTGWTAGTSNGFFDENGVPIPFLGQKLIDAGIGYQLYCGQKGVAGYVVEQDAKSHKKIVKFLRVNTYLDSVLYDPDQDYNW